ncbi:MAG: hypothetical protein OXN44_05285 [Acidimicrobiaceae bacterium]|nr:hypothetical protein [Acidimicrobiaceae bacterium]
MSTIEVEGVQERPVYSWAGLGELEHVGQGVPVAGNGGSGLCSCAEGFLSLDGVEHIVERGPIALDPVRASDCSGEAHPPKVPEPSS